MFKAPRGSMFIGLSVISNTQLGDIHAPCAAFDFSTPDFPQAWEKAPFQSTLQNMQINLFENGLSFANDYRQPDDIWILWYSGTTLKYYRLRTPPGTSIANLETLRTVDDVPANLTLQFDSTFMRSDNDSWRGRVEDLYFSGSNPFPQFIK